MRTFKSTSLHGASSLERWKEAPIGTLVETHAASTLGAKVQCLQSITSKRVKPGANPIPVFAAMIEDVRKRRANGSDVEDGVVCLLRALPEGFQADVGT